MIKLLSGHEKRSPGAATDTATLVRLANHSRRLDEAPVEFSGDDTRCGIPKAGGLAVKFRHHASL
jgi:hypothetical protein